MTNFDESSAQCLTQSQGLCTYYLKNQVYLLITREGTGFTVGLYADPRCTVVIFTGTTEESECFPIFTVRLVLARIVRE